MVNYDFENISVTGRIAYGIMCAEEYLVYKYPDKDWVVVFKAFWEITNLELWDEWIDKTVEIARSMGCKVIINTKHKGQVAGKNTGIKESKGKYWLTIDQDDMLTEGALQKLYEEMQKSSENKIIMAKLKVFLKMMGNMILNHRLYRSFQP